MLTILAINRCHNPYKSTNTQKSPNLVTPFQLNITNLIARNTPFITPFLPPPQVKPMCVSDLKVYLSKQNKDKQRRTRFKKKI